MIQSTPCTRNFNIYMYLFLHNYANNELNTTNTIKQINTITQNARKMLDAHVT